MKKMIIFLQIIVLNSSLLAVGKFYAQAKDDKKTIKVQKNQPGQVNSTVNEKARPENNNNDKNDPISKSKEDKKSDKTDPDKKENVKTEETSKSSKLEEDKSQKEYEKEKKRTERLEKTIDYGTHRERKEAINFILTIKNPEFKKRLEAKVLSLINSEEEGEVKIKAITVAGELNIKEAVPGLEKCLDDNSDDIKIAAIYAIKKIGDQSITPSLIKKFKEQNLEKHNLFIEALIDTLGEFKAAELQQFAIEEINKTKTHNITREFLVLFLGKIELKDSKDILLKLLKDEEEEVQIRAFAANSLANLQIKESIKDIQEIIKVIDTYSFNKKKKYYNLYIYSIAALVKLGDENIFSKLEDALRSDNSNVRINALNLIKNLKNERTIDILKYKMEYDPSPKIQQAARKALEELGVVDKKDKGESEKEEKENEENKNDEDNKINAQ